MKLNTIAASLIAKGSHDIARKLSKVTAFDTRFNLYQDDKKCIYLLDVPLFDKFYEVHFNDGTKKLLTNDEASEILKQEQEYNEGIKNKAIEQLKKVNKFVRMGDLGEKEEEAPVEVPNETL